MKSDIIKINTPFSAASRECSILDVSEDKIDPEKIKDTPYVRIILISDKETSILVMSVDMGIFIQSEIDTIYGVIENQCGIPRSHILLCSTHIHSAIDVEPRAFGKLIADTAALLQDELVQVEHISVRQCVLANGLMFNRKYDFPNRDLGSACIMFNDDCEIVDNTFDVTRQMEKYLNGLGTDLSFAGIHGKVLIDKECDQRLHLVTFESGDGRVISAFCRFNAHPVVTSRAKVGNFTSSDFPGVMSKRLKQAIGCPVLPLNGAFGNTRALNHEYSFKEAKRIGEALADSVLKGKNISHGADPIVIRHTTAYLPLKDILHGSRKDIEKRLADTEEQLDASNGPVEKKTLMEKKDTMTFFKDFTKWFRIDKNAVETDFRYCDLGPIRFFTISGEPLVELASAIEDTSGALVIGNCGHDILYLPTPEEAAKGGYEPSCCIIADKGLDMIVDIARELSK